MSTQSVHTTIPAAARDDAPWPPLELYDIHTRWHEDRPLVDGVNLTDSGELPA